LRAYGFWLIGLTAVLATLFDFALEPFASTIKFFWVWQETKFPFSWYGAPLVNFLGWLVTSLLILAFAAPALINKQVRPRQSPPDFQPLVIWVLALALFAIGAAVEKFWPACAAAGLIAVTVAIFAIRGARW
jgi:putative membrane protein